MAVLALLQAALLPHFPILGAQPQLWLVACVAWTLHRGLETGLVWAAVAGLFLDLWSAAPLGLTSLALMGAVIVISRLQRLFPESRLLLPLGLTALATILFWGIDLLLIRLAMPALVARMEVLPASGLLQNPRIDILASVARGYGLAQPSARIIMLSTILNTLLAMPIYWALNALSGLFGRRKVEI
jgi:rod shape-determining protein MreD